MYQGPVAGGDFGIKNLSTGMNPSCILIVLMPHWGTQSQSFNESMIFVPNGQLNGGRVLTRWVTHLRQTRDHRPHPAPVCESPDWLEEDPLVPALESPLERRTESAIPQAATRQRVAVPP